MRVGIVGCGHISKAHFDAWRRAGAPACAVFDLDTELARSRARRHGVARVYEDLAELVADCDVVDVCTPPKSHAPIARQVVCAGRHLVIEKPVVVDAPDWGEIRDAAEKSEVTITVAHNLKFSAAIAKARRWIGAGRIGRVLRIHHRFLTDAASDRMLVGDRHWSHSLPGGRWLETLPHALYLVHNLAGVLELDSVTVLHTERAPAGAPADEALIVLRGGECIATVDYSANCAVNRRSLSIFGSAGSIEIDVLSGAAVLSTAKDQRWRRLFGAGFLQAGGALLQMVPDRTGYLVGRLKGESPHVRLIRGVVNYVRGTGPAPTPLEEIDYVVRQSDAIGREIERQLQAGAQSPSRSKAGAVP